MDERFDWDEQADRLVLLGRLLDSVDLEGILAYGERAHALGPVMYPSEYRDALARGDLDRMIALARAALDFRRVWRQVRDEVVGRSRTDYEEAR